MQRLPVLTILFCLGLTLPVYALSLLPVDTAEQQALAFLNAATLQQWEIADTALQTLRTQHPDFRPLSVLQAIAITRGAVNLTPPAAISAETDENLEPNLQAELYLRRLHHSDPLPGLQPKAIIRLGAHQPYIFVVDQQKARLYLYANRDGQLQKLADYYSGIGKQGIGKTVRGDHGTPVGIYTFIEYIPDAKLPMLYGAGALTLDYPNRWDRRLKRTGSGIWLHGVPRDTYSRTPRSSRGCVTVSNFIFDALHAYALPGKTPFVLADSIEWQTEEQAVQQRQLFDALLEQWRKEQAAKTASEIVLQEIDMYFYPGEENLVQMNFRQLAGNGETAKTSDRTLYWQPQADNRYSLIIEQ